MILYIIYIHKKRNTSFIKTYNIYIVSFFAKQIFSNVLIGALTLISVLIILENYLKHM